MASHQHDSHGHGAAHGHDAHDAHAHHPTAGKYAVIGLILTIITIIEVSAYYYKPWEESAIYVPSILALSALKFVIVVMFYMHLKYDHRLFRALFTGPFVVAALTLIGLMFLFGHLSIRLGLLT